MRGHLEARGKRVWRAKVFVGRDALTGRQRYLTRTIHGTKRDAEEVLAHLLVEAGTADRATTDGTLAQLTAQWLPIARGTLSPTTMREYERLLARHILPQMGARKVRSIKAADLDAYYGSLLEPHTSRGQPLSSQSIHHIHALIHRLLNQGLKWGWCPTNAASSASPPKVHRREIAMPTREQVSRLLEAASERDPDLALFLRLAVTTGARRGELCGLRWSDLDFDARKLHIQRSIADGARAHLIEKDTKTHATRIVALDPETLFQVRKRRERAGTCANDVGGSLEPSGFVFSDDPLGSVAWRPGRVTLAFNRLRQRVGIPGVRLHDLRHFSATSLLAAGVPVRTVAGRLGHANAATTLSIYAHFLEASDAEAADVIGTIVGVAL